MLSTLFWSFFFAAGRFIQVWAREVIVDDSDTRIVYNSQVGSDSGLNWRQNHICVSCRGSVPLVDLTRDVSTEAYEGTWHTTRGGGRQSNASLTFEGTGVAASFIAFQRNVQDIEPARIVQARLLFFIDGELTQTTPLSWPSLAELTGQEVAVQFIPDLVLFNRTVQPGRHVFTVEYDTGDGTERDTSLALDAISYRIEDEPATVPPPAPPTVPLRSSGRGAIIAGSVVAGVAFIALFIALFVWWFKRRQPSTTFRPPLGDSESQQQGNSWKELSDVDELTEMSFSEAPSPPGRQMRPLTVRPPSAAVSVQTLSSLSIFSRPGADLNGFPSPQAQRQRSLRESIVSASLSYTSYEQQWTASFTDSHSRPPTARM